MPITAIVLVTLTMVIIALSVKLRRKTTECKRLVSCNRSLDKRNDELDFQVSKTKENIAAELLEPYRRRHHTIVEGLNERLMRAYDLCFRLPIGQRTRIVDSPIGSFAIRTIGGYYGESAIFVYFPIGFGFSTEVAKAVHEATDGAFVMEPAPGSSDGGDGCADAIITAGRDYAAFQRGKQGYFKMSPPPDLDDIAAVLGRVIVHPIGVTAQT